MAGESDSQAVEGYSEVSKFVLSFIQALLKTGYYTPDHPETARARDGLFDDLKNVLKGHRELTFMAVRKEDSLDVLIGGVTDEPVTAGVMMIKGMADTFLPKFLKYYERKNLSSFSIKATISKTEFENFIDIMSDVPVREGASEKPREQLDLIKKNVINVSTIFNVDLVGKDRKLPWHVDIALARLKKDLSIVPLFKNLDEEGIGEVRNEVFDDIIRPIKSHSLIKDILVNMDIISLNIEGVTKEDFEAKVTDYVHKDFLKLAAPGVLDAYVTEKDAYEKNKEEAMLPRLKFLKNVTRKVGLKVLGYGFMEKELLLDFCSNGILSVDELPENLKVRAKRREELEVFIKEPGRYFDAMKNAGRTKEGGRAAFLLLNFVPDLLAKGLYDRAGEVLTRVREAGVIFATIESLLLDEIITSMEKRIDEGTKEEQMKVLGMVDMMGKSGPVVLVKLIPHESRVVRRNACEKLVGHGKEIIPIVKANLEKRNDWHFIRNALMVLSDVVEAGSDLGDLFKKYLAHEDAHVRVEAVKGFLVCVGRPAEGRLIGLLKDPEPVVRRKGVWALGELGSTGPGVIDFFVETIAGNLEEDESIIAQILSSVHAYPPDAAETKRLVETVVEMLTKSQGLMGKLSMTYELSAPIKAKMCEALGHLGGKGVTGLLKKVAKREGAPAKVKAIEAVERIEKRGGK